MCIKEVKWTLEMGDPLKRATIFALAQMFRAQMFDEESLPADLLHQPFNYSRDQLMKIYEILETIRNQNTLQIEATKRGMRNVGMELPQFSIDHAKNAGRSLEVWMATIGVGVCPERRDDVRLIWSYLNGSRDQLPDAISSLRKIEEKTAVMTGSSADMFNLRNEEWLDICNFLPEAFVKERRLDL
jgi:hypothetical protein